MRRARLAFVGLGCLVGGCSRGVAPLNVGPLPAGVTLDAHVQYYDVSAATLTELRRGMLVLGPRSGGRAWQAVTQTNYRWTYQFERAGLGCSLKRVRVQLRTTVTFPRWNPTADPDSVTLDWWEQLNTGLMEHERGHAQISVKAAGEMIREMEGLTSIRCESLSTMASTVGARHIRTSRERQAEYDHTTRHGATQIEQAGRLRSP